MSFEIGSVARCAFRLVDGAALFKNALACGANSKNTAAVATTAARLNLPVLDKAAFMFGSL
jgi:hypothetical protein